MQSYLRICLSKKCDSSIRAFDDDGDRGDDIGFFSSEMCCELFSDSSQQEVVCPLRTEVFMHQQPCCHPPNIILPYFNF